MDAGQKPVFITAEERRWRDRCDTTHEFVEEYGRANLRMSRGYEGLLGDTAERGADRGVRLTPEDEAGNSTRYAR